MNRRTILGFQTMSDSFPIPVRSIRVEITYVQPKSKNRGNYIYTYIYMSKKRRLNDGML